MPDIKLKGWSGSEKEYQEVPKLWVEAPESTEEERVLLPFTYGEAVSKTVETLDFSGGDMEVPIAEGELVTALTVQKPEGLEPKNIADGVTIAGIGGTFKGGASNVTPIVFLIYKNSTTRALQSVTSGAAYVLANIPLKAVLLRQPFLGKGLVISSVSTDELFPVPSSLTKETCTIAESGDYKSYQYNYTFSNQGTRYYKNATAILVLVYYVPGLGIRTEDDGTLTLVGSSELVYSSALEGIPSEYKLTAAELQNSQLTSLPVSFLAEQTSLKHLTLPNVLQSISEKAFYNATLLESVVIPVGVTSIGRFAFYNCVKLTEIDIPSSVTLINAYAFQYCTGLQKVTLPEGLTSIGESAFARCTALKTIELPENVKIGSNAFSRCISLESVVIPVGVTSIGSYAFSNCDSLTEISIPEGVTTISSYLCYHCDTLKKVVLPKGIATIDTYAFQNCTALETLDCSLCESVPTMSYTALSDTPSTMQIQVPAALYDTWKTTSGWSSYSSRIVAV